MNGRHSSKSSKRRSGSAASDSESNLTLGPSTIIQTKTDSMSEHSLASPRRKCQQKTHSPSPSRADKGAVGDVGSQIEKLMISTPVLKEDQVSKAVAISEKKSEFSDPVFKKLSLLNGEINRMRKEELRQKLSELRLHTGGVKEVLKKRLKNYYKRQKLVAANVKNGVKNTSYEYLVVIDFEATCEEVNDNFVHEIIEFPAVLINVEKQEIVGMFREFCKPTRNPILSEFCKKLTGVNQSEVDSAREFPEVLKHFEVWLLSYDLGTKHTYAVATDGPWDITRFLSLQTELCGLYFPKWGRHWINVRKVFCNFYESPRYNLETMLKKLGLAFEGRPHCGLDDSKNIARVIIHLLRDGCVLKCNENYSGGPQGPQPQSAKFLDIGSGMQSGDYVVSVSCREENVKSCLMSETKMGSSGSLVCGQQIATQRSVSARNSEDVSDLLEYYSLQSS